MASVSPQASAMALGRVVLLACVTSRGCESCLGEAE